MATYTLLGQTVELSEPAERFFDMQSDAWHAANQASTDFKKWYLEQGNILSVLKGYEKEAMSLVVHYANEPLFAQLTTLEIYDISKSAYDEHCLDLSESDDAHSKIICQYNAIIEKQEAEEEYRAERKASRGRVSGGGFGVGGALKGMATAGAMNAISGAGHSIVNAIGNVGSSIDASSSKNALYKSEDTFSALLSGITSDIVSAYNAHMQLVNGRINNYIYSTFDVEKGKALYESSKKVPEKKIALLVESFRNCPWNEMLYAYIFGHYPEERRNIWSISQRFHVDLSELVEGLLAKLYTDEAHHSEDAAQKAKEEMLSMMNEVGITESATLNELERDCLVRLLSQYENTAINQRQEMLAAFVKYDAKGENKAAIIHDHKVWELAEQYGVQFTSTEIESIVGTLYTEQAKQSEKDALAAKQDILTVLGTLHIQESATLNQLESDCVKRLCTGYEKANEAACKQMIEKVKAYDAQEKNKKPFLDKIQKRIEAIWAAEDGEIFDNVFLNTNIHDSKSIQEAIAFIESKGAHNRRKEVCGCTQNVYG